ncbi:L,D-transpeptidase [Clostridium fallax]|uniref:Lipoprotein-anchoring transpeptidase ErfK/SrfK n=1 Tax=Clostridium fallax TaxID=1533 RepID=A0A1M4W2I6_9CLOT|nr:L,D-transpeptidase [Clostridium fallax]SHE75360.1 Lipoprotein-anchoring transpeptidase ErfK/SrfK [Clostridium fallax]SQB22843.1 ErfK/YbiS/YcfS/YnhG family protein [Clostridium fallax]
MLKNENKSKKSFLKNILSFAKGKKFFILYSSLLMICFIFIFSTVLSYNKIFNSFSSLFSDGKYIEANNLILNKGKLNPMKHLLLKNDMKKYFSNELNSLSQKYDNNEINDLTLLAIVTEMERFNVINEDIKNLKESLIILNDSQTTFNSAVQKFNDKDYVGAFNSFNKVIAFDENYMESLNYKQLISIKMKEKALKSSEELASQRYYSKAIAILEENMTYYGNDKEILSKIDQYKLKKDEILNKNNSKETSKKSNEKNTSKEESKSKEASASASTITTKITSNNINTLNLNSGSPYLMYVDLENQRTQVYKGSKNKWELIKNFVCSTGVDGKETPKGTYTTKKRGEWFYAPEYEQGGKYWTTFIDGYMFHSIPFAKDKETIVDYTLGTPASHGCIRLAIDDAKWIHDNVTIGSKLIIN